MSVETPTLFNTPEAARWLRLQPRTLEKWRTLGVGSLYRKVGRLCLYHTADLEAWLATNHPGIDIEVHEGGQPLYPYYFGLE